MILVGKGNPSGHFIGFTFVHICQNCAPLCAIIRGKRVLWRNAFRIFLIMTCDICGVCRCLDTTHFNVLRLARWERPGPADCLRLCIGIATGIGVFERKCSAGHWGMDPQPYCGDPRQTLLVLFTGSQVRLDPLCWTATSTGFLWRSSSPLHVSTTSSEWTPADGLVKRFQTKQPIS